jgi:serine/threonine-protein kinase
VSDTSGSGGPERYVDDQNRYRLESRIATGGMGEVWRATDTSLGREVAVKVLKSEYADDPLFRSRFEVEAQHAAALHHPGVASVYDVGESALLGREDGSAVPRPFLVMELVDGQPLSALLRGGRPLDPDAVRDLMAQSADAIGAAHKAGIVHRDVKPANLLVTPERRVKITDFGIARASDGLGLTGTGQVMGTPQYLSPEQARGDTATPASDVYSLGVVAFECLVGHRPFDADSPVATALAHLNDPVPNLPRSVPADLAAVVRRALSKDPAARYADGDAFAAALRDPSASASATTAQVPPVAPVLPAEDRTQVITPVPPAPVRGPDPYLDPAPEPVPFEERRPVWPVVLLVGALVAAIVIVLLLLTQGGDDSSSPAASDTTSAPTTTSSSPTTTASSPTEQTSSAPAVVTVNEDDYLGLPVDDVVSALHKLGLKVVTRPVANPGDKDADSVASVSPSGDLAKGDTVTVEFYREAPPTSQPPSSEPTSQPPSDTSTPSAPTSSASQDSGTPTTSETAAPSGSASASRGAS